MKTRASGDAVVERMIFLARQLGTRPAEVSQERQFVASLESSLTVPPPLPARRTQLAGAALLAAACVGPWFWFKSKAEHALSYQITGAAISEGNIIGQAGTSVAFSDGSRLKLASGARARIPEVTAHGARVNLVDGEVAVDIVKADGNAWFVQAGPYEVHVTGTAFDVRWAKERGRIEVDLHRGSVVVTGPRLDGQLRLRSGQRLTSSTDGPPTITRVESPTAATSASPALNPAILAPDPGAAEPVPDLSAAAIERRDSAAAVPTDWSRLVAQGAFARVLAAAQKRGIDNVLSTGSQGELAALADAARYGRNTELARRALLAERKRFARAAAARGAAFFLGGIEPDGSPAALSWYETYLTESPRGPYASQALGRRMMIVHRRGGTAASAPLAREYLQRFAQGPYASAAHRILESSSE